MAGYCSTGSRCSATIPKMIVTIAMTFAKTGRSMKKREITPRASSLRRAVGGPRRIRGRIVAVARAVRLHLGSRPRALDPVHDDPVRRRDTFLDHAEAAVGALAHLHVAVLDLVLVVDDEDVLPALVRGDRGFGNEQPVLARAREAHSREEAGQDRAVVVRK